jgi:hypothetical protein
MVSEEGEEGEEVVELPEVVPSPFQMMLPDNFELAVRLKLGEIYLNDNRPQPAPIWLHVFAQNTQYITRLLWMVWCGWYFSGYIPVLVGMFLGYMWDAFLRDVATIDWYYNRNTSLLWVALVPWIHTVMTTLIVSE